MDPRPVDARVARFVELQRSPRTRRVYASDLADWTRFLAESGTPLDAATEDLAIAWRAQLEARALAPVTLRRKITVAGRLYQFLTDEPGSPLRVNPFARMKRPRVDASQGKTPYLSRREVELLLGAMNPRTPRGLRDRTISLLLFNQGLRVSEVAGLRREHLSAQGGYTVIATIGKGGSDVRTVLSPEVAAVLAEHLKRNAPHGDWVFRAMPNNPKFFEHTGRDLRVRHITPRAILADLKRYARAAGLDETVVRPHSGRVFFITEAYARTGDLERVARAVGHKSLTTTRRYLRYQEKVHTHAALSVKLTPKEPPKMNRAQ